MGYTGFTVSKIEPLLVGLNNTVIDLGAQNDYRGAVLPAPYISEWYRRMGYDYRCIDLNGENGAYKINLGVFDLWENKYELLNHTPVSLIVDAGTSEHVGKDGRFDWGSIYNCWLWKHNLLMRGGIMYNENPKTGNWPGHGFNYYSIEFYRELERFSDYEIVDIGEHPAQHNPM